MATQSLTNLASLRCQGWMALEIPYLKLLGRDRALEIESYCSVIAYNNFFNFVYIA